jgi:hypothetical protein
MLLAQFGAAAADGVGDFGRGPLISTSVADIQSSRVRPT